MSASIRVVVADGSASMRAAIAAIMEHAPTRLLLICPMAEESFRALSAGALELVCKPVSQGEPALRAFGDRLRDAVKLMSEVPAETHGTRAGGAVLTGMGDDGARGLLAIRQAGVATFAQDPADCAVFGMPGAALALGAAAAPVPIESLAELISNFSRGPAPGLWQ